MASIPSIARRECVERTGMGPLAILAVATETKLSKKPKLIGLASVRKDFRSAVGKPYSMDLRNG